jgi:hypothetical protein
LSINLLDCAIQHLNLPRSNLNLPLHYLNAISGDGRFGTQHLWHVQVSRKSPHRVRASESTYGFRHTGNKNRGEGSAHGFC